MAIPHANPGDVISIRPWGAALVTKTPPLLKTEHAEVVLLVVAAGTTGTLFGFAA